MSFEPNCSAGKLGAHLTQNQDDAGFRDTRCGYGKTILCIELILNQKTPHKAGFPVRTAVRFEAHTLFNPLSLIRHKSQKYNSIW